MMKCMNIRAYLAGVGAVAAAALAVGAAPAMAQASDYDYSTGAGISGVTVYAPRYVPPDGATGAPMELVRVSRVVDYSDIDPYTPRGRYLLTRRIQLAAQDACHQIDREYPDTTDDQPPCVRTAVQNAMYDVDDQLGR
jgi:UrcA family protein